MAARQNVSYKMPYSLNAQITARAELVGRSRNEEMRQLLADAMRQVGDREIEVVMPTEAKLRSVVWLDLDLAADIASRAKRWHRNVSTEVPLLAAWALQNKTDSDLRLLSEMLQRAGQEAQSH